MSNPVGLYTNRFERREALAEDVEMFWTVDTHRREIEVGMVAKTTGWLAVGFSDKGTMKGADIAIVNQNDDGTFQVGDYFSKDFVKPIRDPDHLQNYVLLDAERNATHTAFRVKRPLETCDEYNDVSLGYKPLFATYATGFSDELAYHATRGAKLVSLISSTLLKEEPFVAEDRVFRVEDINATALETIQSSNDNAILEFSTGVVPLHSDKSATYKCIKVDVGDTFQGTDVYIRGSAVEASSTAHHLHLYACPDTESYRDMPDVVDDCFIMPDSCDAVSSWSLGIGYVGLPDDVSGDIGAKRNKFILQLHGENPTLSENVTAEASFRLQVQATPTKYDYGTTFLTAVDEDIYIPAHEKRTVVMDCPASFSRDWPEGGVKLIYATAHMHLLGTHLRVQHIRNGVELPNIIDTKYYDFNKQTIEYLDRVLLPEDRFILTCEYDATDRDIDTVGGFAALDEMCQSVLVTYPRLDMAVCATSLSRPNLGYRGNSSPKAHGNMSGWEDYETFTYPSSEMGMNYQPLDPRDELCHVAMMDGIHSPTPWDTWSISLMVFLLVVILTFVGTNSVLKRASSRFQKMQLRTQQNVKVYITSCLILTVALFLTLVPGFEILTGERRVITTGADGALERRTDTTAALVGIQIVGAVMAFELCAKVNIDRFLFIHHVLTLAVISVLWWAFYSTLDSAYASIGVVLSLHASTEQPIYLSLLYKYFYPAQTHRAAHLFQITGVYTAITKLVLYIVAMVLYLEINFDQGSNDFGFLHTAQQVSNVMKYLVPILVTVLFVVQIRQTVVLFQIAAALLRSSKPVDVPESDSDSVSETESVDEKQNQETLASVALEQV